VASDALFDRDLQNFIDLFYLQVLKNSDVFVAAEKQHFEKNIFFSP